METFVETQSRRDKKKYAPKQNSQSSQQHSQSSASEGEGKRHQKRESKKREQTMQVDEESKGPVVAKEQWSHRPSKEEGFTGDSASWFDGKTAVSN